MSHALRAIIIDDEQKGIDALRIQIERHIPDVIVVFETTVALEAISHIESYRPEIVFLDINMPEMSGFELLDNLKWKEFNLIFTTAHQEYALKALKQNALDYLLKPIDPADLKSAIDRLKSKLNAGQAGNINFINSYTSLLENLKQKNKLVLNLKSGIESIDINSIISLESKANYTIIHTTDEKNILVSKNLKEFDVQLCNGKYNFMRVHNSFIINLGNVLRYLRSEDVIVMMNGRRIPIARSKKEQFYLWMGI